MSFFSKRGPTKVEIARENGIRKNITREFGRAVKVLQVENVDMDGPVQSSDSVNTICGTLEAVFLHGLKDSVGKKIASYMYLMPSPEYSGTTLNYWSFIVYFTHKDVISQLKNLSQINTEIGFCRAWVRAAINDGLIESYINAMLADNKKLEQHYQKTAYLRDIEQPEILKSYLKGLMLIEFQLPYNSSVLNNWTTTALTLSGMLSDTPQAFINTVQAQTECHSTIAEDADIPKPKRLGSPCLSRVRGDNDLLHSFITRSRGSSNESVHKIHSRSWASSSESTHSAKTRVISSDELDFNVEGNVPEVPCNTPYFMSNSAFTSKDIEEIKKMTATVSRTSSECSSSTISCPDPGLPNLSPAEYITDVSRKTWSIAEESETSQNFEDNCSRHEDNRAIGKKETISNNQKGDLKNLLESAMKSFDSHSSEDRSQDTSDGEVHKEEINKDKECDPKYSDGTATDKSHRETAEFTEMSSHALEVDINLDQSSTSSLIPQATPKPKNIKRRHSREWKQNLMPKFTPPKLETVEPQLSTAEVETVATSGSDENAAQTKFFLQTSVSVEHEQAEQTNQSEREGELSIYDTSRRTSLGNSLSVKTGWSSAFETEVADKIDGSSPSLPPHPKLVNKNESFGTLLRTYTPTSSGTTPSVDDLIQELDSDTSVTSPAKLSCKHQTSLDQLASEYEVISPLSVEYSVENISSMFPSQYDFLGTIANERGLDSQNYQCKGCKRPVGLIYGKPRICTFDGGYYCFECHENDEYHIPSVILHNWDFRKHHVSKKSLEFLQEVQDQPLLDMMVINSKLYEHVPEMERVKNLRTQLCYLKPYIFTCNQSIAEDFRRRIWPREYLYDSVHSYSLGDLLQVASGHLEQTLKKVYKSGCKHVYNCILCSQKGFICEICSNPQVIYPFEMEQTSRCEKCKAVYHRACKTDNRPCPKCRRHSHRDSQSDNDIDAMDYASTPP